MDVKGKLFTRFQERRKTYELQQGEDSVKKQHSKGKLDCPRKNRIAV